MKKFLNIFLVMLITVGVIVPPSTASAYSFSSAPKPKETSYKGAPVYYLDIQTPDNKNGMVPASQKHLSDDPDKWERLANREFALRDRVWKYVWEWRNQPRDKNKTTLTPMTPLTWTGNLQGSIAASASKIEAANPKYKIKEIMVYPVHKERSYAISIADAILKQSWDNYRKNISEVSTIDAQWSGIPDRNKPYVWTGGAPSPYPWKTYFPSPIVYNHADYPGGTRFGNYDLVYKVDSTGRSRWLNTPDFWRNWAKDTNNDTKVSFTQDIQKGNYYGRAHPMYYTPGNHPYMRNMKYSDWTFTRLTDSFPNATCPGDESCGFPYTNWNAMVHMEESDYKIEAILEKKEEEKPNPPLACDYKILPPAAGTKQTADKMDANPSGENKADDRDNHKFNVLDGIPTSESLYTNAFAKEYVHKNIFTEMSGRVQYNVPVKKTYHLVWEDVYYDEDGDAYYVPRSDTVEVVKNYDIFRPYLYWLIDNLEVYGLEKADMANYALPGGEVTMYPKGYTPPNVNAENDDDVEKHVFPAKCKSVDKGTQTINGGTSRPSVPDENFKQDAESATGKTEVENDLVEFNGSKIMDNKRVVEKGPTPTTIPEAKMINRDVLYEHGMVISKSLVNKKDTPTTGNIYYNLLAGIKGGDPQKIYPILGINTVTVHTPVVIFADVSDDKEHNQRTKPDQSKRGVILDRPFTIYMPTGGPHRNILGYGDRDYAKYVRTKQVRFPFDVWHYKNNTKGQFVPANTWIDIPVAEVASNFYLPVWIDEGNYEVLFRTIAENAPADFTTQPNANLDLQHHVATDVIPVNIIGRVYDFKVSDIADYNWGEVFRTNKGSYKHTGNYYWVQDRGIDGELRGNKFPYVLPIMPGSHPNYKNVSVKTGYHFKFDLKTKGNMFGPGDGIRITPSFYFVTKDGKQRQEVDLYYKNDAKNFVRIGSPEDKEKRYVIMNDRLRNVPQGDLVNAAEYAFDHYPNRTTDIRNRFIEEYFEKAKEKTWVGDFSWMILNYRLKTHIGPTTVPAGAMVDEQRAIASIHQWYGEYSLPANVYTVAKGTNLAEHGRMNAINDKSLIFLKNGYIIVNFNIETIRNEDLSNPYLQYIYAPLANQWQIEGYKNSRIDPYGNNFALKDGDVVFYHGDLSSYDDFQSNVTH
ncbi:DUF5704 domain-containing protein [Metabacillus fastidiosus]|uniref:DUF5704 domain-containing protein n=1 Tax=Metabacillus fastidiosus TaxID=1458 RepID=A0ABU6NTJ8_9BACI|nr:DUF5704 domain-containing protein [Metabacillus fastidiosus]MED4400336.1 DUF5704 domain-containing protein [Metabacillus fastidiosus]